MEPAQNSCHGRTLAHAIEIDVGQSRLQRRYTIHTRMILPAGQRSQSWPPPPPAVLTDGSTMYEGVNLLVTVEAS